MKNGRFLAHHHPPGPPSGKSMTSTDTEPTAEDVSTETTGGEGAEQKPKLTLDVKVDQKSACERHITVSIARADVDRYFKESFSELMPKAEVPGFRAGRAPRKLVESRFREQISEQVKGKLLMDSMTQVSEEHDFSAISEPDFDYDAIKLPPDGPLTFEFDLEVRPDFDLPEWKGLAIKRATHEFGAAEVDKQVNNVLERYAELAPREEPAEAGDFVVCNLTFNHQGRTISTAFEQTIRVRPTLSFTDGKLEGFDQLMVGAKAGDQREAKIVVSADAQDENLRGEAVDARFEVLEIKRLELPAIDQRLLDEIGGFESEEELREAVTKELKRQLQYHQQRQVRQQITAKLIEKADWALPPDLLKRQSRRELERAVLELQSSGFSQAQIQAHANDLRQNTQVSTARALKEHFILERIAEDETIDAGPEDYDKEVMLIAMQQRESPRRVRARLEKKGLMDTLRNQIVERKVIELITSHANFTDVNFQPEENQTEAVDHAIAGGKEEYAIPEAKPGGPSEPLREPVERL